MEPIIAANWKMNKTGSEVKTFIHHLLPHLDKNKNSVWIAPSATALTLAIEQSQHFPLWVGAQNIHHEKSGPFTGEISAGQVAECGARFVILGHSERRRMMGETESQIALKIALAIEYQLIPLLCIGETEQEQRQGKRDEVLKRQLMILQQFPQFGGVVAYEPVWAIGTGKSATMAQIEEAQALCRAIVGPKIALLYGGSVTPSNVSALRGIKNVDGVLVGGASLDLDSFTTIIQGFSL